jgi:hypothetical protein
MFGSKNQVNQNLSKKEKIALLKKKHEPLFEKLGVADPVFIPKMVAGNNMVYFFPSELNHERDIYIEKVDRDYVSEDPDRILYKWTFKPNYASLYDTKELSGSRDDMYIVPFDEFTAILEEDEADEFAIPNPDEDAPISELTIRDLTAILTGKPVSHKLWLNKILKD